MTGVPVHVPSLLIVSVWVSRVVPVTAGSAVFAGSCAPTVPLGAEVALALPPAFVAVTTTRIVLPTSAGVCV